MGYKGDLSGGVGEKSNHPSRRKDSWKFSYESKGLVVLYFLVIFTPNSDMVILQQSRIREF